VRLRWSSLARRRAADIVDHIARDRPRAATEWIDELDRSLETLKELPLQGHAVPEWDDPSLRQIMYGEYRVIYEVRDDGIDIMTVKHGRRLPPPASRELSADEG
jgi:plasmid stabilization system protein ParE